MLLRKQLFHSTGNFFDMKKGISIIIPAYNEEAVIRKTLEQFSRDKENFNLELIVSDDSSNDKTVEIARSTADKVVSGSGCKKGRSATLNRGVKEAKYDIFLFLDADMIIEKKKEFFEEVYDSYSKDPRVAGGMIDFYVYPQEENFWDWLTHKFWNLVMRGCNLMGWGISTPGFQMGRRDIFEKMNGFDEDLRLTQDVDYSLRLSKMSTIHYFNSSKLLESPRRYRDEGYLVYAYRSSLRWLSILFRHKSYGEYKPVR